ncbi:MAG TPA: DNA-binding domain-containing protein [Patescibacteria group bacterium]|nr:DNA-binding domain-containing protein [Patescibacteria group bacterium]
MSSLRELQAEFRAALLGGDERGAASAVADDGPGASARLAVYRHHVFTSLTAALEATFPVVCRLVDRRFFGWVADQYVRVRPPAGPCLFEYGADFADFIADFPACATLPWLADVARLEWAMNTALYAPEAAALEPDTLGALAPADVARLTLRLDPSTTLLASRWPVDAIWRANQAGADGVVDLDSGGVRLEVRRVGEDVVYRAVPPAVFAFRAALAAGGALEEAVDHALDNDPAFDLAGEIRALLDERLLIA